jgi:general secretion pathway protein L
LRRSGTWWLNEFLDLFPERLAQRLRGRGRALLVIAPDADKGGAALELRNGARRLIASEHATPTNLPTAIDRFLHSRDVQPADADIGLRLPSERLFRRQIRLPAETIDAIDAIVAQDLAKKTPFAPDDIYSDHIALEHSGGNRITVQQWVVRREYVQQALATFSIDSEQLAFVMFAGCDHERPEPLINLRPRGHAPHSWYQRTVLALCCGALMLGLLAVSLKYWRQQATIDRLNEQVAAVGTKAKQVRALVDQLQEKKNALLSLRRQRNEAPGLIDLWEETTRVLPSHSWISEFRLVETAGKHEQQVTISGFSSAAPSLVGIIDSSSLLFDAALTSPIAFDPSEGRERFTLQAKVKMPEAFEEAAR